MQPPSEDKASISVKKTIKGLSEEKLKEYGYQVTIKLSGPENQEKTVNSFSPDGNGNYSANFNFENIKVGTYTVSEEILVNTDKEKDFEKVYDFYVSIDGEKKGSATYELVSEEVKEAEIINAYTPKIKTLTIKKQVSGNMGDKNGKFTFSYRIDGKDEGKSFEIQVREEGKGEAQIEVPAGSKIEITEVGSADYRTDAGQKGAEETDKDLVERLLAAVKEESALDKKSFTLENVMDDEVIYFVNYKNINAPTGIRAARSSSLMMLILSILGMMGLAATGTAAKARKKNEE